MNQMETSCTNAKPQKTSLFKVDSGFFFPPRDDDIDFNENSEDEDSDSVGSWGSDEL